MKLSAQEITSKTRPISAEKQKDTLNAANKNPNDTIPIAKEVKITLNDTNKKKKDGLDATIRRTAEDY
ncbi:hypothetical protein NHE85_13545, partial [Flavobacterium sp. NRK1]